LTQNQTKIAKAIDCPINVRFIFTAVYLLLFVASGVRKTGRGPVRKPGARFAAD